MLKKKKMSQFRLIKIKIIMLYAAGAARAFKARGACAARDACF